MDDDLDLMRFRISNIRILDLSLDQLVLVLVLPLSCLVDLDLLLPALFGAERGVPSVHVDVVADVERGFAEEAGVEEVVRLLVI